MSAGKLEGFSGDESEFSDWSFRVRCRLSMSVGGAVESLEWREGGAEVGVAR